MNTIGKLLDALSIDPNEFDFTPIPDTCPVCSHFGWADLPPQQAAKRFADEYKIRETLVKKTGEVMPDRPSELCWDCRVALAHLE